MTEPIRESLALRVVRSTRHLVTGLCVVLTGVGLMTVVQAVRSGVPVAALIRSGQIFLPFVFLFILFNNLAHRYGYAEPVKGRLIAASRLSLGLAVAGFVLRFLSLRGA